MKLLTKAIIIALLLAYAIFMPGCKTYPGPYYKVNRVERLGGNRYKITTDSFIVVKKMRGGGFKRYSPDSVRIDKSDYVIY